MAVHYSVRTAADESTYNFHRHECESKHSIVAMCFRNQAIGMESPSCTVHCDCTLLDNPRHHDYPAHDPALFILSTDFKFPPLVSTPKAAPR